MPANAPRLTPRLLAPAALVAFGIAFLIVLLGSGVLGGGGGEEAATPGGQAASAERRTEERPRRPRRARGDARSARTYTVKLNDTLGSISERTGVPVERLQELNPDLDPQALVSGQRIKLRE